MLGSAGCPSEILNGLGNHRVGEIGRGLIDRAVLMTGRHISSSSRRLKSSWEVHITNTALPFLL